MLSLMLDGFITKIFLAICSLCQRENPSLFVKFTINTKSEGGRKSQILFFLQKNNRGDTSCGDLVGNQGFCPPSCCDYGTGSEENFQQRDTFKNPDRDYNPPLLYPKCRSRRSFACSSNLRAANPNGKTNLSEARLQIFISCSFCNNTHFCDKFRKFQ